MPQAYDRRRLKTPTTADESQASVHRAPLDPDAQQSMVERLYTPDLLRQRRARASVREQMQRRIEYDATADAHLAGFWARQRVVRTSVRPFSRNAGRSQTPGPVVVAVDLSRGACEDRKLPAVQRRSNLSDASSDVAHSDASSNRSSSAYTTPASSPAKSSVAASSASPPRSSARGSSRASSPSPVASPERSGVRSPKPESSAASDSDAGYSDDYESDFASPDASPEASPTKSQKVDESTDKSPASPTGKNAASSKSVDFSPSHSVEGQRSLAVVDNHDADAEEDAAVEISDADVAVLCMLVAPAQAYAASVRRLRLHDGIDLTWIAKGLDKRPATDVTLLSIPMEASREMTASTASVRPDPAARRQKPAVKPKPQADADGSAAPDPEIESKTQTNSEQADRPPRRPPHMRKAQHIQVPAEDAEADSDSGDTAHPSITSPRSAYLLLRSGVRAEELWPVSRADFFRVNVHQGAARNVLGHRFETFDTQRRQMLDRLQREYVSLSQRMSSAEVMDLIAAHRDDGFRHDPAEAGPRVKKRLAAATNHPYAQQQRLRTPTPSEGSRRSSQQGAPRGQRTAAEKHALRQMRLREQFDRKMAIEQHKAFAAVKMHQKELSHDQAVREQRRREAEARQRKADERDLRIEKSRTAAADLREATINRHEKLSDYSEARSAYATERARVESLAEREYRRAVRQERERVVAANERQQEYRKLCLLQAAQQREATVNGMLHDREVQRRRMDEDRRMQAAELREASEKLDLELLRVKREGLNADAVTPTKAPQRRAQSAMH